MYYYYTNTILNIIKEHTQTQKHLSNSQVEHSHDVILQVIESKGEEQCIRSTYETGICRSS